MGGTLSVEFSVKNEINEKMVDVPGRIFVNYFLS